MSSSELSRALFTDLYELTMAQAYWQNGMTAESTFSLFFRSYPPNRAYFIFAGLLDVIDYLENFHFTNADISTLRSMGKFDEGFLDYLASLHFTGSVRAMQEGTIFFANEPVIEITGPVIEAQIIETFLVNQVNVQSILATKASRVIHAGQGRTIVDFAARRTHGVDAADSLARVSYMVGYAGTSNVLGGGRHGIPTFGTVAHSFVTAFDNEIDSYRAYARSFPDSSTFLVDTYDTIEGTKKAIQVAREMRRDGHELRAIRLDSGDLLELSKQARALLDEAGLEDVQVFASGGLDEFEIEELLKAGAPVGGFGVGTKVGVSADAPWTDCAYKLVTYDGRPVLKLSSDKQTIPCPKQVYRIRGASGNYLRDIIASTREPPPDKNAEPLLTDVMRGGVRTKALPDLTQLRDRFSREFACLPTTHKALRSPELYNVTISNELKQLQAQAIQNIQKRES
jgi:nicotinate phosphoribosyltransferase